MRGQIGIAVREFVFLGEIERAVGLQLIKARPLAGGDGRAPVPFHGGVHRAQVLGIAGCQIEINQGAAGTDTLTAGDGGRLKPSRPSRFHTGVVLLGPSRLRLGHLGQENEIAAAPGGQQEF